MAITEEEKRSARAYNIGYMVNMYEPRLMQEIIKRNSKNEFVKSMQVGRDHQELHSNIPRNDYSREFKNGFHNGRTLSEHNPELIDRLIATKTLNKDYKKGLESAKTEHSIKGIQQKMSKEPRMPAEELRANADFKKGFNVGYRLAEQFGPALRHADNLNGKYAKFIDGVRLGKEQYDYDLSLVREKNPDGRIFYDDLENSKYESAVIEDKLSAINDISIDQLRVIDRQKGFEELPRPKWLQKDRFDRDTPTHTDNRDKDIEIEPDK